MLKLFFQIPLLLFSLSIRAYAQADTIVVYDLSTQTTATILPVAFNPTVTSDFTSSSPGSMGNAAPLPQVPPLTNLFQGSGFSRLAKAADFFNLTNYPMRTVVRLQFHKDTTKNICTGMIVSPCMVLTSAICTNSFGTPLRNFYAFDSIRVCPAFNNGSPQASLPSSVVKKIYIFKKYYRNATWDEMALLELKDPIGLQTGWTGIGFNSNTNFTAGNVYHKFSYPASYQYNDSSKYYNGDTLYYNYGTISENPSSLLVSSSEATGIAGQGGSTFMFDENGNYYSLGSLLFAAAYNHSRYTNAEFYQMKNVINNLVCPLSTASIPDQPGSAIGLQVYPNPVTADTYLQFNYDHSTRYELKVISSLGQVAAVLPVTSGRVPVGALNLAAGIYLLQLSTHSGERYATKLVVD